MRQSRAARDTPPVTSGNFFKWEYYEGPFYGKNIKFWGFLQNEPGC
jgi:hypothetical protein